MAAAHGTENAVYKPKELKDEISGKKELIFIFFSVHRSGQSNHRIDVTW